LVNRALNGSDEFSVASKASDNSRVILRFVSDTQPPTYYLLDRRDKRNRTVTKQITVNSFSEKSFLFSFSRSLFSPSFLTLFFLLSFLSHFSLFEQTMTKKKQELPGLEKYELAPQKGFEIRARDGLLLPSYVSLPPAWIAANDSSSRNSSSRPGPLPLVVVVRAAPWARDSFGFTPAVQAIANLGAAVLQVNFRGSSGFGRGFVAAAAGEWGGRMTTDLVDAVAWAVEEGIADPDRVAIFGFSYGGYAALDALTTHPDVFSCAAALSGAARFDSSRSLNPPGWVPPPPAPGSEAAARFEERGFEISPINHVDSLRGGSASSSSSSSSSSNASSSSSSSSPQWLLQAIGGRDEGKLTSAARELAKEAAKRGVISELLVYPKEGHALRLDESRVDFASRLTRFLGRCLGIADAEGGGREPPPVEVAGVEVEVELARSAAAADSSSIPPRPIRLGDRAPAPNSTGRIDEAGVVAKGELSARGRAPAGA
jgi:dipeptidyl aminopeptidase/acylaminoacyl peptidase